MPLEQIAVYGRGGFAREVAWLVQSCAGDGVEAVCFVDDNAATHGQTLNGLPTMGLEEARRAFPAARIVGAVGSPATRERMMRKAAAIGFGFATVVHPRVERSKWVEFGSGTVVCAGTILTTNITLGEHVQVNLDCTIGHDAVLGAFTTLAPGVHISGMVHTGQRVYIGTGAVVLNGSEGAPLVIGDDAVIGAAACVTRSVAARVTVVGVPARPLPPKESR